MPFHSRRVRAQTLCDLAAPFELVAVSLACIVSGCCVEPDVPCISWLKGGETYRVELVQHYDTKHSDGTVGLLPYGFGRYKTPEKTCGSFELNVGDTLQMKAGKIVDGDNRRQNCGSGCYYRNAIPSIEGVENVGELPDGRTVGGYEFSTRFEAQISGTCAAQYTVGITPVMQEFIDEADEYLATDLMLYRYIAARDPDACAGSGSEISEGGECWDSWAVRVLDSEGNMISKELPPKGEVSAPDAGSDAEGS